jgi:transposase
MSEITTIGVDLAKHFFQVHGIYGGCDSSAQATAARASAGLLQPNSALSGWLEACATAHYWARELGALGHEVRLFASRPTFLANVCR